MIYSIFSVLYATPLDVTQFVLDSWLADNVIPYGQIQLLGMKQYTGIPKLNYQQQKNIYTYDKSNKKTILGPLFCLVNGMQGVPKKCEVFLALVNTLMAKSINSINIEKYVVTFAFQL